jgi:hypothetical protein
MRRLVLGVLPLAGFISSPAQSQDFYNLKAQHSNKCAHVQAASQDNGGNISQWDCESAKYLVAETECW